MKFSIITVTLNSENTIRDTLNSVSSQTYKNIEHIIIDGGSTDMTHSIIGKYCAISWDVTINAISHPNNHISISAFPYVPSVGNFVEKRIQKYSLVNIKNDVWIGANSIVLKGVKMSNGSVLGANSLLNRDTEEYEICAGNPAKKINFRN